MPYCPESKVERGSNTSDSIVSCRSMTQIVYVMFSVESFVVVVCVELFTCKRIFCNCFS